MGGILWAIIASNTAASGQEELRFDQSVRQLLQLQDQMAEGDESAIEAQRKVIARIEERFGAGGHPPEASLTNAKAALSYVLSGGPPEIADGMAKDQHLVELYTRLLKAAVHFKKGEDNEAQKLIRNVAPLLLPPDIAGRVALMQAMLIPDSDHEKKLMLFDRAAQLMPGTLVEEAALRRSLSVAGQKVNQGDVWKTSDKYLRRFGKSLFAKAFVTALVNLAVATAAHAPDGNRNKLELLMNRVAPNERRQSYLLLARLATQNGLPSLAQFSAQRARRLSDEGGSEWQKGILYDAIHGMTGEAYADYVAQLRALDPNLLDSSEQMLLRAALAVAEQMRAPGKVGEDKSEGVEHSDVPQEHEALLARAERELKAADALIRSLNDEPEN